MMSRQFDWCKLVQVFTNQKRRYINLCFKVPYNKHYEQLTLQCDTSSQVSILYAPPPQWPGSDAHLLAYVEYPRPETKFKEYMSP